MQVMHSDLKTKNVLLTKDHVTAKIADVGLSQFLDHQTNQPNIIACEHYSPVWQPECM
jgi:serine/threonine protein kinase